MSDGQATTLVLADDHPVILGGLAALLKAEGAFEIVARCPDGSTALQHIRELRPAIAVLDINMPEMTGLQVLAAVISEKLRTRVVLLTAAAADDQIASAVNGGVWGIVLKDVAPDQLVECLKTVAAGQRCLPSDLVDPALARIAGRQLDRERIDYLLTDREREISRLVAEGMPNKVIARKLTLAEGTVKIHLHNIYQKLGVNNRTSLAMLAQKTLLG